MIDIISKAEVGTEDCVSPVKEISSTFKAEGTEKPQSGGGPRADMKKSTEENILKIYRERQRILTEANSEKDRRLERLEKEFNDHNIQHKEGIYWLRLQLETSRHEKNAADERIAELQNELRRLSSEHPSRNISMDPTICDSIGNGDEKDNLITRLQSRVEKYESSFVVMEVQMEMIKSSSGQVVKTLKEEIADLMEDRTRSELDLLNQLSELDNENRRRQLEYTLELHNKDEKIEILRSLESCSISAKGHQASSSCTLIYNGSDSTENTKSSLLGCEIWSGDLANDLANDLPTNEIPVGKDELSLILRLGEEKAELQRKLDEANKELEDSRSGLNVKDDIGLVNEKLKDLGSELDVKDNLKLVQRVSEERRAVDMSIDRVKTVLKATNAAVSNMKALIETSKTDDDSSAEREKERMLSVLESAKLIHEEVKLSIMLIELKLRNGFDCLKKNWMTQEAHHQATPNNQEVINDMKEIQNDTLIQLGKAEADFSRQIKDLQRRKIVENSKLGDMLQKTTPKRARKHDSSKSSKTSQNPVVDKFLLSCQADRDSRHGSSAAGEGRIISRDVLHLLERELMQFAERMLAKNKKIVLLKEEVERHKKRESSLRKELRASIKSDVGMNSSVPKTSKDTSSKSNKAVNDISETNEDEDKHFMCGPHNSRFPQNVPREILARKKVRPMTSNRVSPDSFLSDQEIPNTKFKGESSRRRKGMSEDTQEGGDPLLPGHRRDSIGFVPSPQPTSKKRLSNSTSTATKSTKGVTRRQPSSREIKQLVFLPPCFFSDLE